MLGLLFIKQHPGFRICFIIKPWSFLRQPGEWSRAGVAIEVLGLLIMNYEALDPEFSLYH